MSNQDLPRLRLLPKTDARSIRHGAPWVYQNQLVMDRRARAIAPGSLAILEDNARNPLALVGVNPNSKITARVLDLDPNATIDKAWIMARLRQALSLRDCLFQERFYRLIHAEADGLPGVIIDLFGDIGVLQPNAAWAERHLSLITDALRDSLGLSCLIKNASGRSRSQEGLDANSTVLFGSAPGQPRAVSMNGATYFADLMGGQKTGLFYDQRSNHNFAAQLAHGRDVLDVFSHVGGFGLAALAQGARHVTCLDASQDALDLAVAGARAMGHEGRFETLQGDAFAQMEALLTQSRKFDVVICDPPAFAPSKSSLEAGLRAYEKVARMAAKLVRPGGFLGLCSCSHAADLDRFRAASLRGIGRAGRESKLIYTGFASPDHPNHPHLAQSAYLKALFFHLPT